MLRLSISSFVGLRSCKQDVGPFFEGVTRVQMLILRRCFILYDPNAEEHRPKFYHVLLLVLGKVEHFSCI